MITENKDIDIRRTLGETFKISKILKKGGLTTRKERNLRHEYLPTRLVKGHITLGRVGITDAS